MAFGPWVRGERERAGISLKDFSRSIEISTAYWSRIERGLELAPYIVDEGLCIFHQGFRKTRAPPGQGYFHQFDPRRQVFAQWVEAVCAAPGVGQAD